MKFLYFTDSHFTAKNPSSRIDNIQDTIKRKLNDIKDIINEERIDVVLHGGDLFHSPDVSNKFCGELATILKSFNVPIYVVPGNHDIFGHNMATIDNTKLGLFEKTGVVKLLTRDNPQVFNDNGFLIGVEGQEFHIEIDTDISKDYKVYNKSVDFSILLIHSMLLDHEFFNGIKHTQIKDVITDANIVLAGHYHPGFKTIEQNGTTFINPGSMLRVDSSIGSYNYTPSVVVIDSSKNGTTYNVIPLKSAKNAKEVFKKNSNNKDKINDLILIRDKLKGANISGFSIYNLLDNYKNEHPEDANLVEKAKEAMSLTSADASVDNGFIESEEHVYIKKVEIYNFQAHENKVIDFTNGLNVLVGSSNSGKMIDL